MYSSSLAGCPYSRRNNVAVDVCIAVPILATVKVFRDHVKSLSPIGEFLER